MRLGDSPAIIHTYQKGWDVGDLQLGAPFCTLASLLSLQTLPLRKASKSQQLPEDVQDQAYRL